MARILCVDDTEADLLMMEESLRQDGHDVLTAGHVPEALSILEAERVDLIVSDYRMPKVTGLEFLHLLSREGHEVPLIMSTAFGTVEDAVAAVKAGAIDYITKPVTPEQLQFAVEQALELSELRRENAVLREEVAQVRSERAIVGESQAVSRVLEVVSQVAPTRASVLLQGESGTGKELIARAIHDLSDRSGGPFVAVNCAAMPENLVESLLFGHEKGAFTGATERSLGAFERADGGTLLLDEISEMRLDLQAKLLRALQEQEFERVGGGRVVTVDVRVVATTNRDLRREVDEGNFRQDLFYRLNVMPIHIPPLRDRKEDIPALTHRFVVSAARRNGKEISAVDPAAVELLQEYDWPGNVRQLEHAVERAVIMAGGDVLRPADVSRALPGAAGSGPASGPSHAPDGEGGGDGPRIVLNTFDVREAEKVLIQKALEETDQNRTRAAELLGLSPRTLRNKLNKPSDD
jgi:DNA-binding NtrC family response regulator